MRLLAEHCDLYNAALPERREAWRMRKKGISYGMQSAQLKEIRAGDPNGQGRHSFTAQQQTLRRLDAVFAAFFDRVKTAQKAGEKNKPGYPRFKPYQRFSQVMFVNGDGVRWQPSGSGGWAYATFQAVGTVKVRDHRRVTGTVKTLQLKREHRRWYVIATAETAPVPLPATGRTVGVDVGVARFLTTSDGQVVAHPRFLATSAKVIADLERRKARARQGSGNRSRLRRALAKEHRKVCNRRRDFHHRPTRTLVELRPNPRDRGPGRRRNNPPPAPQPDPAAARYVPVRPRPRAEARLNRERAQRGSSQHKTVLVGEAEGARRAVRLVDPARTRQHPARPLQRALRAPPAKFTFIYLRPSRSMPTFNTARNIFTRGGLGFSSCFHRGLQSYRLRRQSTVTARDGTRFSMGARHISHSGSDSLAQAEELADPDHGWDQLARRRAHGFVWVLLRTHCFRTMLPTSSSPAACSTGGRTTGT